MSGFDATSWQADGRLIIQSRLVHCWLFLNDFLIAYYDNGLGTSFDATVTVNACKHSLSAFKYVSLEVKQCTLPCYIIKVIPLPPGLQNSKVPHSVAQYGWFLNGLRCSDVDMNSAGSCLSLEWSQCSVEGKIHMFSAVKLAYVSSVCYQFVHVWARVWGTGLLLHCTFFRNSCEIFDHWLHQGCSMAVFNLTSWWMEIS